MCVLFTFSAAYCSEPQIWGWNGTEHAPNVPGFQTEAVVYDAKTDTQVFCGFLPSHNAIVMSYRGTVGTSIKDWIEDLMTWKTKTNFPGCSSCEVHDGFFKVRARGNPCSNLGVVRLSGG